MPPLRANPEIIVVDTQEELDAQFDAFRNGENAFLAASDNSGPHHTFIPPQMDCQLAAATLTFEGVSNPGEILSADYFPDHEVYARMTDDMKPVLESTVEIVKDEQGRSLKT